MKKIAAEYLVISLVLYFLTISVTLWRCLNGFLATYSDCTPSKLTREYVIGGLFVLLIVFVIEAALSTGIFKTKNKKNNFSIKNLCKALGYTLLPWAILFYMESTNIIDIDTGVYLVLPLACLISVTIYSSLQNNFPKNKELHRGN